MVISYPWTLYKAYSVSCCHTCSNQGYSRGDANLGIAKPSCGSELVWSFPIIGARPRVNRTTTHARRRLACAGERAARLAWHLRRYASSGNQYPGRGEPAPTDPRPLVDAVDGAHGAGNYLWRQTDESERFVECLAVRETPPDIVFQGGRLLRVVVGLIQ